MCERCGNFMCASCAQSGAATRCPACRELSSFAFDVNASFDALLGHAFATFQRDWLMLCLGALVFYAALFAGSLVANVITTVINAVLNTRIDPTDPFGPALALNLVVSFGVSMVVNVPVQGVATVGFYRLILDALAGRKADLTRMFGVLPLAPQAMVLQLVTMVVVMAPTVLVGAITGFLFAELKRNPESLAPALLVALLAVFVVLLVSLFAVLPLLFFALPELLISGCGPVEALRRAWTIGSGQRLRLFGYGVVMVLLLFAGFFALCLGIVPATAVAYLLLLGLFLALRRGTSLPAPANL
ncbi:MAG: hypothetical protein ACOZQL_16475 [Myxococcota bacterium]